MLPVSRSFDRTLDRTFDRAAISLAILAVLASSACSGGSSGAQAPAPLSGAQTPAAPSGDGTPSGAGGTSYRFDLPAAPAYEAGPEQITDNGTATRSWRYAVAPNGPYCFVTASEQPRFAGDFPASTQAIFAGHSDRLVVRNDELLPAPPGALAALVQEATLTVSLDDGSSVPSRLFQRAYLTTGGTLIQLTAAGPQDQVARCQLDAVVSSLRTTGVER